MRDWFRSPSWSETARVEFERRLARARKSNRPQYLRIQAGHLAESGLHSEALSLLDRAATDYDDRVQVAQIQLQRAEALDALGQVALALDAFRATLKAEAEFPGVVTAARLRFPLFVVRRNLKDLFGEMVDLLDHSRPGLVFPVEHFEEAAARALIAVGRGDADSARSFAKAALASAAVTSSGLGGAKSELGLVSDDHPLLAQLREIAR